MKINIKKIIGAALVIGAAHQVGQVVGAYKVFNNLNGPDDPRVKEGFEAAKEIRENVAMLKRDFKSHFFGTAAKAAEPDPEEEDEFCAEEGTEAPPVYEETEEEKSPDIEVTVNDQPED